MKKTFFNVIMGKMYGFGSDRFCSMIFRSDVICPEIRSCIAWIRA